MECAFWKLIFVHFIFSESKLAKRHGHEQPQYTGCLSSKHFWSDLKAVRACPAFCKIPKLRQLCTDVHRKVKLISLSHSCRKLNILKYLGKCMCSLRLLDLSFKKREDLPNYMNLACK